MNKNNANDYKRLIHTIDQCHCMLLPTKSECAGISFVEASAYGLPSFTHQTGGIPDYISNGINGYMLPLGSSSEDFGRKIKECLLNGEMERMSYAAVEYQRHECNYEIWGKKMAEYFENLIC
jgi:hypothetical protein